MAPEGAGGRGLQPPSQGVSAPCCGKIVCLSEIFHEKHCVFMLRKIPSKLFNSPLIREPSHPSGRSWHHSWFALIQKLDFVRALINLLTLRASPVLININQNNTISLHRFLLHSKQLAWYTNRTKVLQHSTQKWLQRVQMVYLNPFCYHITFSKCHLHI